MDEEAETIETTEQAEQNESPETVPTEQAEQDELFEEAVAQGKALVAADTSNKLKLGELADGVEARYGEATLERFAERIDVEYETVKRLRSVYRAYKDQDIGATSPSFGVLSALAAVENRAELIRAKPDMTTAEARELAWTDNVAKAEAMARAARAAERAASAANATNPADSVAGSIPEAEADDEADEPEPEPEADEPAAEAEEDDPDWRVNETRRWAGVALRDAATAFKLYGPEAHKHLTPERLRGIDEPGRLVDTLRDVGAAMTLLAGKIEALYVASVFPETERDL